MAPKRAKPTLASGLVTVVQRVGAAPMVDAAAREAVVAALFVNVRAAETLAVQIMVLQKPPAK